MMALDHPQRLQLLWYYADLEYNKCYSLPGGLPDTENNGNSCLVWRRFANLFETSQSLFWASFGLVSLAEFELSGIKEFTRFWALLMFGCYSVCNLVVLLNMLIAMMSNSYQIISEKSGEFFTYPSKGSTEHLLISNMHFSIFQTPSGSLRVPSCGSATSRPARQCRRHSTSCRHRSPS